VYSIVHEILHYSSAQLVPRLPDYYPLAEFKPLRAAAAVHREEATSGQRPREFLTFRSPSVGSPLSVDTATAHTTQPSFEVRSIATAFINTMPSNSNNYGLNASPSATRISAPSTGRTSSFASSKSPNVNDHDEQQSIGSTSGFGIRPQLTKTRSR
jgi:hypothetical protein